MVTRYPAAPGSPWRVIEGAWGRQNVVRPDGSIARYFPSRREARRWISAQASGDAPN